MHLHGINQIWCLMVSRFTGTVALADALPSSSRNQYLLSMWWDQGWGIEKKSSLPWKFIDRVWYTHAHTHTHVELHTVIACVLCVFICHKPHLNFYFKFTVLQELWASPDLLCEHLSSWGCLYPWPVSDSHCWWELSGWLLDGKEQGYAPLQREPQNIRQKW